MLNNAFDEQSVYTLYQLFELRFGCGVDMSYSLSSHDTASCSEKSSSSTLQIFEISGFTYDSRLKPNNFSLQSAHDKLNQDIP